MRPTLPRSTILALLATLLATTVAPGAAAPVGRGPARGDLRESSIYIPYEKLRAVFEQEGRGVFLPYGKFMELWRAAREGAAPPPETKPPVDHLVTEMSAEATVSKDVVTVRATVRIEVLAEGWTRVPLRLADAAITKATLGDAPARIVFEPGQGYELLVKREGEAPREMALALEFAKAYEKAPGQNRVSFQTPLAPVSRWDVRVPESGVKIQIRPLLAATEVPPEAGETGTHVLAFVGAAPQVGIEWTPKAEGARGLEALATANVRQQVWIEEGVVRTRAALTWEISRAELGRLQVEVPADQKVVNVYDPNVREWSVETVGDVQTLTVELFEPAQGTQGLLVELQTFGEAGTVAAPVLKAVGVGRQLGVVVVDVAEGWRAEAETRENLLQLDADALPADLAHRRWDFRYRYATVPYTLVLHVEKIRPRILATTLVEAHLAPEDLTLETLAVFDVQRAGVFQLAMRVPDGYEVRSVRGQKVSGAAAAEIDNHRVEDGRLRINLSRKALGQVAVAVQLHRPLREPDLLAPTGQAASVPILLPRVDPETIERESGRAVVYAPAGLRVNPAKAEGVRPISHGEAVSGLRSTAKGGENAVLGYAYTDDPVELVVSAERRKPQITVAQLLVARIDSGVVKSEATLFYEILYSGVKTVRIDVPAALAEDLRVTTSGIRHMVDEDAEDVDEGYVAWELAGETELFGTRAIRLAWEQKIETLDVGGSVLLDVPRLIPREVDRAWGQIVLVKAESIDVAPTDVREGLRPIDPQHDLMPGVRVKGGARALEFRGPWRLRIQATRYEPKDVKATAIERGLVRIVLTAGDTTSVQAVYRMKSARQRLALRLPEGADFDMQPLRIDGRPVTLEQGGQGRYFVPLVGVDPDQPFLLELRYLVREGGTTLVPPAFPEEPAVQKVDLSVYVPREWAYLGSTGPWNPVLTWHRRGFTVWPEGSTSGEARLGWVAEGRGVDRQALANFATDGRHLLFSTLRPSEGEEGALVLHTMDGRLLKGLVLAVIVIVGLVLAPARPATRALAIGASIVAAVLIAVFLPTFMRAIVSNAAVGAVVVVLVVWVLWYLLVTRPRDPVVQERLRRLREGREAVKRHRAEAKAPSPTPPPKNQDEESKPEESRGTEKFEGGEDTAEGGEDHA